MKSGGVIWAFVRRLKPAACPPAAVGAFAPGKFSPFGRGARLRDLGARRVGESYVFGLFWRLSVG